MESYAALPKMFEQDIRRAITILREEGCSEIFVFGSAATGQVHSASDLDLAVRGCSRGHFFDLIGRLLLELEHPVDLINLDSQDPFALYLRREGLLVQIA